MVTTMLTTSTRLQAINAMLRSGGESVVTSLVTQRPDVIAAIELLDEASREVQGEGWSFNTEHGYEVRPSDSIVWTDGNQSITLNIFVPPPNLMSFRVTQNCGQYATDVIVRPPHQWLGGPEVFYDRTLNRDGMIADRLFIDPLWLLDYDALPQLAKNLVSTRAIRRYLEQVVGDNASASRKERDENIAYRAVKRAFGSQDRYNVFNNYTTARHFGGRPFDQSTVDDRRIESNGTLGGTGYTDVASIEITPNAFNLEVGDVLNDKVELLELSSLAFTLEPPSGAAEPAQPHSINVLSDAVTLDENVGVTTTVASMTTSPSGFTIDPPVDTPTAPQPASITVASTSVALTLSATPDAVAALEVLPGSAYLEFQPDIEINTVDDEYTQYNDYGEDPEAEVNVLVVPITLTRRNGYTGTVSLSRSIECDRLGLVGLSLSPSHTPGTPFYPSVNMIGGTTIAYAHICSGDPSTKVLTFFVHEPTGRFASAAFTVTIV